jgi:hypothetical protein
LHVRKNWYVGLNPDPVDHSHPDIGKAEGAENPFQHAAHTAQAAHQHQPTASHAPTPGHAAQQHPPPPPPAQQQPAHAASIPTQPLAQGQQQQQGKVGSGAPAVPQSPSPQPQQQHQPQAQQTQQAGQQQQQPAQQSPQPLKDLSAVLKVKERIENYEKQFGEVRNIAASQQTASDGHQYHVGLFVVLYKSHSQFSGCDSIAPLPALSFTVSRLDSMFRHGVLLSRMALC